MAQFNKEAREKEAAAQATIVLWDNIKANPPKEMKLSPLSAAPHKSRMWRAILDLYFRLRLEAEKYVPSVNKNSEKTAPAEAIDQIGHALSRIIHAFAQAPEGAKIFENKFDVKDGFWRMNVKKGQEWNFCYVLPQKDGEPVRIVCPTSLQMGWVESPGYFCAASETARDVAEDYINVPVGQLPAHKFQRHTEVHPDFQALPEHDKIPRPLSYMIEVYVNDFICIAIPTSQEQLHHVSKAIMTGIHDVFPPSDDKELDAILFKKVAKGEGQWAMQKDILGFEFDRTPDTHTVWLEETKRNKLLTILQGWLRGSRDGNHGICF